ncbi:MAG: DUF4293 family protein [Chitinophagales bacterium]
MIQRIQTIYLFLAAALAIAFIFLPYAISGTEHLTALKDPIPALAILGGVTGFFALLNIFFFKNHRLQINICRFAILLLLATVGVGIFFAIQHTGTPDLPNYGAGFPVLSWIFLLLAMRNIRKDDKLLRDLRSGRLR